MEALPCAGFSLPDMFKRGPFSTAYVSSLREQRGGDSARSPGPAVSVLLLTGVAMTCKTAGDSMSNRR